MLTWQKSEAGTIREWNQDRLVIHEDQGQLLFADGQGPAGRELAEAAIEGLLPRLVRIQAQARPEGSPERLAEALREVLAAIDARRLGSPPWSASRVELGAAVVVEGRLALAIAGRIGFMAWTGNGITLLEPERLPSLASVTGLDLDKGSSSPEIERARAAGIAGIARRGGEASAAIAGRQDGRQDGGEGGGEEPAPVPSAGSAIRTAGPFPLAVGDWLLLCSQGLLVSQPLMEVITVAPAIREEPEQIAEALFRRATQRYDGDDRTMALLRFLPNDLRSRLSRDVVLETHIDRQFKVPLWAPLAALAGIGWFAFRVWRAFSAWWPSSGEDS